MASHVYLARRWCGIQHPDAQLVDYDEGTTLLLVQYGTTISAYETFSDAGSIEPAAPKWSCSLAAAAPIITLKCSPDGGLLAVQRSKTLIEFVHVHSGNTFIHGSYRGQNAIQVPAVGSAAANQPPTAIGSSGPTPAVAGLLLRIHAGVQPGDRDQAGAGAQPVLQVP
jgi:hypothetical protein